MGKSHSFCIGGAHRNTFCSVVALCCGIISGCGSQGEKLDIVENFDGNSFNRETWEIAQPDAEVGTVEIKDDALLLTIPPAPKPRSQIRNNAKVSFDGDFEVQMDFELVDPLPEPVKDYTNVELIIFSADGNAHLSRTNHHGAGNGFVSYFAPKVESLSSHWQHTPTESPSGTLKIKRTGDQVEYVFEKDDTATVIGTSDFGFAPVSGVGVALSVSTPTEKPFQVRIDNLEIHSVPRSVSMFMGGVGKWIAIVAVGLLLILGSWLYQSSGSAKRPASAAESGAQPSSTRTASADSLDDFNVS